MDAYVVYIAKEAGAGEWAIPVGAVYGLARSQRLGPEEKQELIEHYGLPERANLALRSAGKGLLGGIGGTTAYGLSTGAVIAGITARKARDEYDLVRRALRLRKYGPLMGIGALVAGGLGAHLATGKYSLPGLEKIRKEKEES